MAKRGHIVRVFGEVKLIKRNPWRKYKPDASEFYLATPMPWVGDASKLSGPQTEAAKAFARIAKESIQKFPADGKFSTLVKRVEWIGDQLRGIGRHGGKVIVPLSATPEHPKMKAPENARVKYTPRNYFGI